MKTTTEKSKLVGLFFTGIGTEGRAAQWQGQIVDVIGIGYALVQLCSWATGAPTCMRIISMTDLMDCTLHQDQDAWREAGERLTEKNSAKVAR